MKTDRRIILPAILTLTAGILLGWLFFGSSPPKETHDPGLHTAVAEATIWTCSMHPRIRQNEPGDCPICGMDLIPLESEKDKGVDPAAVGMSETAMRLAGVQTAVVEEVEPVRTIRLNGKVRPDERLVISQSSHIPGRIEKLSVNYTGQFVTKGQTIALIYSPELVTAQEELLAAYRMRDTYPRLFHASRAKLKNWKLSDERIERIIRGGKARRTFPIQAEVSGFVGKRNINLGDYVVRGQTLYEIIDLSKVWILLDVYESDIPWVSKGDKVNYIVKSLPGETYQGRITYIDPVINPKTRVARARIEAANSGNKLKPDMFVSATLDARPAKRSRAVAVPRSAVLWTGKRSVVYIKSVSDKGVHFVLREVTLGPDLGESYMVEEGLEPGEEIAVNGAFSIDAAAQLAGKPSMMNPKGGPAGTGHDHGGMSGGGQSRDSGSHEAHTEHASFTVGGNCEMCRDRIEKAALSVAGVVTAKWDADSRTLHLEYGHGVSIDDVHHAVAAAGHDTEKLRAPDRIYADLPACCHYERLAPRKRQEPILAHAMVKVAGNCDMCKERIEKAALSVAGVRKAEWNKEKQILHLEFNAGKTNTDEIQLAVAKAGHDTEKYRAPDDVYNSLPKCCLYERLKTGS